MPGRVYAARFFRSAGDEGWVVISHDPDRGLQRVTAVSDWLESGAASRLAANTLKSQAEALALLWNWCLQKGLDALALDVVDLAQFVSALQAVPKGLPLTSPIRALPGDPRLRAPSTVAQRVTHIKAFYRWAAATGAVATATGKSTGAFTTPRASQRMTVNRLSETQTRTLRAAPLEPRNRLVVELMYGAGLREGEALGLTIRDLCLSREIAGLLGCDIWSGPHAHIRRRLNPNRAFAKSRYERLVPLTASVLQAHRDFQAWAFDELPNTGGSEHLLLSTAGPSRGGPWSMTGFGSMWRKKVQSLPGLGHATPHQLRHTFASELLDAGVPSFTVQELLGHRSPQSTSVYTHAHMSTLRDAVARLSAWREDHVTCP